MSKRIKIELRTDGTIKADIIGFPDQSCTSVIPLLETLLEAETIDSELKPEYIVTPLETILESKIINKS